MEDRPWWILIRCAWDSGRPRGQRWDCKLVLVMDAEGPDEPDLAGYSRRYPREVITLLMWKPTAGILELRVEGPAVLKERYASASRTEQGQYRKVVLDTIRQIILEPPASGDAAWERRPDPSVN